MLVCVPTNNDAEMEAVLHAHFGSSPFFTLINTDTGDVQTVENRNAHHSHGTCHPMGQLTKYRIDTVLCSAMGRRAVEALNSEGIKTLVSDARSVREALDQLADGTAKDIDPARACRGHGQRPQSDGAESRQGRSSGFGRRSAARGNRGSGSGKRSEEGRHDRGRHN